MAIEFEENEIITNEDNITIYKINAFSLSIINSKI